MFVFPDVSRRKMLISRLVILAANISNDGKFCRNCRWPFQLILNPFVSTTMVLVTPPTMFGHLVVYNAP